MRNLIIVSGHCGTTLKAAQLLANKIGGADIFDTSGNADGIDFSAYDNYIFGSNVRMFMLNPRFKKWSGRLRKFYRNKRVYGYLIGCMEQNDRLLSKFANKLAGNSGTVYAGGEFVEGDAAGKFAGMYSNMKNDCLQKGDALPYIREAELDKLAEAILQK